MLKPKHGNWYIVGGGTVFSQIQIGYFLRFELGGFDAADGARHWCKQCGDTLQR